MSRALERADLLVLLMRAASATAAQINADVIAAGFTSLRPAHGLAFICVAGEGATVSEIAAHLGITKQSAAAIVEDLAAAGYLVRSPHPRDGRAQLVRLTERGLAATEAATKAAREQWRELARSVGEEPLTQLADVLITLGQAGSLRPVW
jgi:DNA-binding MarR family transcriptional regulator